MGKDNRQRRADKARRRARQHTRGSGSGPSDAMVDVGALLEHGIRAVVAGDQITAMRVAARLSVVPPAAVAREAERVLLTQVRLAWEHGWQPAELVRQGRRAGRRQAQVVAAAVAADHSMRARSTLHERWAAQLDALELPVVDGPTGWLAPLLGASPRPLDVLEGLAVVGGLMPLTVLLPPPGSRDVAVSTVTSGPSDDPVLVRVRALLAQAESTSYEAEAATFTAKAQELMARHAIDAAMVWSGSRGGEPASVRLPIDDPYADAKALLLHVVAEATRCKAVWSASIGLITVVGYPADLTTTEVLFTSLLVQSATALQAEASAAPPGSRVRSASFRSSFLVAYAQRVGERLAKVDGEVVADADAQLSGALLPVLADRRQAVADAFATEFPDTRASAVRGGWDGLGRQRGWTAGGRAALGRHEVGDDGSGEPAALRAAPAELFGT